MLEKLIKGVNKSWRTFAGLVLVYAANLLPSAYAAFPATEYDFEPTQISPRTAPGVSASDFLDGPGITAFFSIVGTPAPSRAVAYPTLLSKSAAEAIANQEFFEFSVRPDPGFELNLTALTMQINGGAVSGNAANFFVRSSIDGFKANLGAMSAQVPSVVFHRFSVDLDASAFQSADHGITFRTYLFGNGNAFGDEAVRIDSVVLEGVVTPVPLPAPLLLLTVGLPTLVNFRRK